MSLLCIPIISFFKGTFSPTFFVCHPTTRLPPIFLFLICSLFISFSWSSYLTIFSLIHWFYLGTYFFLSVILSYEHQSISMDSKYASGFRLKGQFLLSSNHPEQAVIAFFQAKSLETNIASFAGLETSTIYFFAIASPFFTASSFYTAKYPSL